MFELGGRLFSNPLKQLKQDDLFILSILSILSHSLLCAAAWEFKISVLNVHFLPMACQEAPAVQQGETIYSVNSALENTS